MSIVRELLEGFRNLFRWWFVIAPWEQAVRVRLGKNLKLLGAGVHLRIPFIDRVYIQSIRRRMVYMPAQTLSTLDRKPLTIAGSLGYQIVDLLTMYQTVHQPKDTIIQETMSHVAEYVATHSLADCAPHEIESHVDRVTSLKEYGIKPTGFRITDFVVVRTYRLLMGEINRWEQEGLNMNESRGEVPS